MFRRQGSRRARATTFACLQALVALMVAFLATASVAVDGFAPGASNKRVRRNLNLPRRSVLLGAATSPEGGGSGSSSEGGGQRQRTLYEVLGARPDETHRQLRRRYTELARLTHPDAVKNSSSGGGSGNKDAADFTEIAAAWSVLSDPKERLRYDRSLKAKGLTDSVGSMLGDAIDTGFSVAVPFLFEKAPKMIDNTASDIERTMKGVAEGLDRARRVADVERKRDELVRKAAAEKNRAKELRAKLSSDRRLGMLQDDTSELTSARASQIVDGFDFVKGETAASTSNALRAVDALAQVEEEYKEKATLHRGIQKDLGATEQKLDSARRGGQAAEEQLEAARQRLEEARSARELAERSHKDAIQQEKLASTKLGATEQDMDRARREEQLTIERLEEARRRFEEAKAVREEAERIHKDVLAQKKQATASIERAKQKIGSTRQDRDMAEGRLVEAERKLEEARSARERAERTYQDAAQQERLAASGLERASETLRVQRDRARHALRQTEGLNTSKENAYLKEESRKLDDLAAKLLAKADELRTKAEELKREAD